MTRELLTNWSGNYTYSAARLHHPQTQEQLQVLVRDAEHLRVLGSRHSFNSIADTTEDLISLQHFDRILGIDYERHMVTIESGVTYGQLGAYLHRNGYALNNMASLPHISVVGACATATHGSGEKNGNLATAVAAIEIVTASGEVAVVSREQDGERFEGMVVALGGLGVITKLTLDIVPTYEVRQDVYVHLPFAQLTEHFDAIQASAYSVSLFTDWQGEYIDQVWLKSRVIGTEQASAPTELFGATLAQRAYHPIMAISAENCTQQLGVPGPWHERLPHFRMEFTPSVGEELQTEYFVPRHHALAAFEAIRELHTQLAPYLMITEIRTIAADNLWMSPCYQQDCVGIHFTWLKNWPAVEQLLPLIEAQLAPFDARPHWAKLFTMPPAQVRALYQRLPDFQQLLRLFDPSGKFRNRFLDSYIAVL